MRKLSTAQRHSGNSKNDNYLPLRQSQGADTSQLILKTKNWRLRDLKVLTEVYLKAGRAEVQHKSV